MRVLAADVGGTSMRAALIDDEGAIQARDSVPTPPDPDAGVAALRKLWDGLGPADAAALVIAGGIRDDNGEITQSPNLPQWEGTRPGDELSCKVLNDANGALLGEAWIGALRGKRTALMLTLGTGVGGGVMADGKLWTGANGCAGEIGHVAVSPDYELEELASATAVAAAAGTSGAKEAAEHARAGDPRARAAFNDAGRALGIVLAGLVNVLNPEAICIGGGMSPAFDLFSPSLLAELDKRAFRLAREAVEIFPAALGGDAGILGAAWFALQGGAHGS